MRYYIPLIIVHIIMSVFFWSSNRWLNQKLEWSSRDIQSIQAHCLSTDSSLGLEEKSLIKKFVTNQIDRDSFTKEANEGFIFYFVVSTLATYLFLFMKFDTERRKSKTTTSS